MYRRILVPVDGSATSDLALSEAMQLARLTGATLRIIHVIDVVTMALTGEGFTGPTEAFLASVREAGEQIVRSARQRVEAASLPVETCLYDNTQGRVAELVADAATDWHADLVVAGTHGRRGVKRLMLGSDADQIVRLSPVPVLVVRDKQATLTA